MNNCDIVSLSTGPWRANVAPTHGCVLRSLTRDSIDILRPAPADGVDPLLSSCYPCVPWFGRLYKPVEFQGERRRIAPTHPACDAANAIHGYGWMRPWDILSSTRSNLDCSLNFEPTQKEFPFPFRARQVIQLTNDGLEIALEVENTGSAPMPIGLGLHPFFPRREDTKLKFKAAQFWTPPENSEGHLSAIPSGLEFSAPRALPTTGLDHSFADLDGPIHIISGEHEIRMETNAPHMHIYAPLNENFFCAEPITNLPGRFGKETLKPDEKRAIRLHLSVRAD